MKKLFGMAVAMMLGLSMIGCEETDDLSSTMEETEVKQEETVQESEVEVEEEIEETEPEEEVEETVLTMEDETFKHYLTTSLDGEEYDKYFNETLGYGQEIEFDGYITDVWQSEKYSTRSELGLAAGDYDGNDVYNYKGITIVTRDIATYQLNGLREGANVRVKGYIEDYDLMYRGNLKINVREIEAR